MQQYLSKFYNRLFGSVELSGDSIRSCAPGGEHAFAYMEEGDLESSLPVDDRLVQSAQLPQDMKLNDLCAIQMPDRGGQHSPNIRKSRQVGDMWQFERSGQYSPQGSGQRAKQAWGSLETRGRQASGSFMPPFPECHNGGHLTANSDYPYARPASALDLHSPVHRDDGVAVGLDRTNVGQSSDGKECSSGWFIEPGVVREKRAWEGRSFGAAGELHAASEGFTCMFDEKLRLQNNQVVAFNSGTSQPSGQGCAGVDFGLQTSPTIASSREWDGGFNHGCNRENYLGGVRVDVEGPREQGDFQGSPKLRPRERPWTFAGAGKEQPARRSAHRKKNRPHHGKKLGMSAAPEKPKVKKKKRDLDGFIEDSDDPPPPPLVDIPGVLQSKPVTLEDGKQKSVPGRGAGHRRQKSAATQTQDDVLTESVKDITPPTSDANRLHVDIGSLPFATQSDKLKSPVTPGNGRGPLHPHHVVRESRDQNTASNSGLLASPSKFDVPRRRQGGRAFVEGTTYFQPVQPNSREEKEQREVLSNEPLRVRDPPAAVHGSAWQDSGDCSHNDTWEFEGGMYGEIDATKIEKRGCIGYGATSAVYYATYYSDAGPREVVLKTLLRGCKGHDIQKEFRRESQILVKVPPHPNVVKMIGVMQSSMVLEFCNKGSLYSLLHDPSCNVTWGKVFDIALAVAQGMRHLHQNRIIHRDLKPGNLLMHENDGEDIMKIADFGLSRNFLANSPMTNGLGTWQYSAPEVLREDKYSQKADVYSYGMVVWEACTRTEPYHRVPATRAISDISRGDRPNMPPSMPSSLRELVKRCLDQDPNARPQFRKIITTLKELKPSLDHVKDQSIPLPPGQ